MKKICLSLIAVCFSIALMAQEEEEELPKGGFKKENLFTGGTLNISFFNGTTALGLSPYLGYSVANWLDVAANLNFNYISERDIYTYDDKLRQTTIGPGAFVRIFPVNFLFMQAQFEHNFITLEYIPVLNSGYFKTKEKFEVNSLLLGLGYASGRESGNRSYYYMSISFDALKLANSPYVDGQQRPIPIIAAGFNIALFQGSGRR